MIEISHNQARRWLRRQMDHRLPNEQWTALQSHLEHCPECRIYSERLSALERNIHRTLAVLWDSIPEPSGAIGKQVIAARQRRKRYQQKGLVGGVALAVLAIFFLLGGFPGIEQRLIPSTSGAGSAAEENFPTPTVQSTALPIASAGDFPDVVVYDARKGNQPNGKWQVYLLNPGSQPIDISSSDANDTDPVWSPDGQWIAYLSDRSGQVQVYVTNLANNRVVQLTNDTGIGWQGPLSWSADGQALALTGIREDQGQQSWIYQVPLDGSGSRALEGTRGGSSPEFSATNNRLAYTYSDGNRAGVAVIDLQTGERSTADWPANSQASGPVTGSDLDWAPFGDGLVYISMDPTPVSSSIVPRAGGTGGGGSTIVGADGAQTGGGAAQSSDPVGSQVVAVRSLSGYNGRLDSNNSLNVGGPDSYNRAFQVAQSRWAVGFRGVSWTPFGGVAYLEDLNDARANDKPGTSTGGCWTVQTQFGAFRGGFDNRFEGNTSPNGPGFNPAAEPVPVSSLCVDGGLDRSSWTPDGRWMVVLAHQPGDTQRWLYAVRVPFRRSPGGFFRQQQATPSPTPTVAATATPPPSSVLRLVSAPWTGTLPRVRPSLRNASDPLKIDPQPVTGASVNLPPSDFQTRAGGPSGQILYTVQNNSMSVIVRANPDGTGGQVVLATQDVNSCPRWSPDGHSIAYISQPGGLVMQDPISKQPQSLTYLGRRPSVSAAPAEIFVTDEDGQGTRQVSHVGQLPESGPDNKMVSYGCPVWSPANAPGGPFLAARINTSQGWYLGVFPVGAVGDPRPPRYVDIAQPVPGAQPVWSLDGRFLFLAYTAMFETRTGPRILKVTVPDDPKLNLNLTSLDSSLGPGQNIGLAVEGSGKTLILLELPDSGDAQGAGGAQLRRVDFTSPEINNLLDLPSSIGPGDIHAKIVSGEIVPLVAADGIGLMLRSGPVHNRPQNRYKAVFFRYDSLTGALKPLAAVPDLVTDTAWSPDGNWLIYSTESGLWGLDINGAAKSQVGPVWLSPQPVQDLDWR